MRALAAIFLMVTVSGSAVAQTPPSSSSAPASRVSSDPQLDKLRAAGKAVRWNYVPTGKSERYGHAEILVKAPLETIRGIVTDYKQYKDLAPGKFKTVRVVAKDANGTDLYIQVPILKGAISLWTVLRFAPVRNDGAVEIVEGKSTQGNIKEMNLVFRMRKVDDKTTVLESDLLIGLSIPAPQTAVDEELRDAAADIVNAVTLKAESGK